MKPINLSASRQLGVAYALERVRPLDLESQPRRRQSQVAYSQTVTHAKEVAEEIAGVVEMTLKVVVWRSAGGAGIARLSARLCLQPWMLNSLKSHDEAEHLKVPGHQLIPQPCHVIGVVFGTAYRGES